MKDDYKTVFVRNISFKASEAEIMDFFTQAGKVEDVRRGTDDQGQARGASISCALLHVAQAC